RKPALPLGIALFPIGDLHRRIAVVIPLDEPFESQIDERRRIDDELARLDAVAFRGSRNSARARVRAPHGNDDTRRNSQRGGLHPHVRSPDLLKKGPYPFYL